MQAERAELYFRQGSSDKVYQLQLENVQELWSVHAQWGRRGSALQSDMKASGVSYEEAKRIYDRILREKTGKGYQVASATVNGDAAISVGLPTKEHSGHAPELLTPIEEPEALQLAQDPSWWFQQKFDGRRLAVQRKNGQYTGINKLGQVISIDSSLTESLDLVQREEFLVDGEITQSHFRLWDLLSVNDRDLRIQPYEIRYVHLTQNFRGLRGPLQVCETAMTVMDKKTFVKRMHEANTEGFVCKNRFAPYAAGRAGQHFKCKFVTTASFIVGPKPDKKADDGHRSIAVYLLACGKPRFMGTVGVPDRYPLPRVEQIVELRYLYCHPGPDGKLIQAKYFGKVRDDIALNECSVSQLKLKASDCESSESGEDSHVTS
ncbi:MAG TPA: WGR domain-containing protein [Terriglobales bacterium]|nr:WGR domain-containing protein [Terriglobales bacterium]